MGRFLNPDNSAFNDVLNSEIYVVTTGLINYTNSVINTTSKFICNSRPRRFGKSIAADMLSAYYSKGCDSKEMFSGYEIAANESFTKHLNRYDVIHFDVQWCLNQVGNADACVSYINNSIISELKEAYSGTVSVDAFSASDAMSLIHAATGARFVVIIDEWDVLIRDESNNTKVQEEYINFLRGMFKGTEPAKFIALAYLTGILPIKRLKTQSALNNFSQYTMLSPGPLAEYFGFTESEVMNLCKNYGRDYDEVKRWYDGYILKDRHVYNPNAVVQLMLDGTFQSYWSKTGTFESIRPYIGMDFEGLKSDIIDMIAGNSVEVHTEAFQNDMISLGSKDDVLTLLIHLGYLAYDQEECIAYIPNEEIRQEFVNATRGESEWDELISFEKQSRRLLEATLDMDADAVAAGIEQIHTEYASSIQYNDENSLSSVLTIAYLSSMRYYFRPMRELPTGRGFADFVLIPKKRYAADYPALLIELKWNKDVRTAIQQIKDKNYPESLMQYTDNLLLVGISYDKKTREHSCVIERNDV